MIVVFSGEYEMKKVCIGRFLRSGNSILRCCSVNSISSFRVFTLGVSRPFV